MVSLSHSRYQIHALRTKWRDLVDLSSPRALQKPGMAGPSWSTKDFHQFCHHFQNRKGLLL